MKQKTKTAVTASYGRILLLTGLCLLFFVYVPAGTVTAADGSYIYDPAAQTAQKDRVVGSWEEYEASRLPLIAALPEKDIYLYAVKPRGVILYTGDSGHYYEWDYLTPRFILPSLNVGDYDSDGEEEIAVVTYTGSGTGVSIEDLHIVEARKDEVLSKDPSSENYFVPNPEYYKDHFYTPEAYTDQLDELVKLSTRHAGNELMLDVSIAGNKSVLSMKPLQEWAKDLSINEKPCLGSIVYFNCRGNGITAEFALGITGNTFAAPIFIGNIKAEVIYREDGFALKSLSFEPEEEYRVGEAVSGGRG